MSGVDDLLKRDGKRWEAARRRATGVGDRGLGPAISRYYGLYLPAGALLIGVGVAVAELLVSLAGPVDWGLIVVLGVLCAVLAAGIGGLVYNSKRIATAASAGRVDVMLSLTDEERKSVRRQIRGKEPVDPAHVDVTRAVAVQLRRGLATQLMMFPVQALILLPQVVHFAGLVSGIFAVAFLLFLAAGGLFYRDFRRMGEFLVRTQGSMGGLERPTGESSPDVTRCIGLFPGPGMGFFPLDGRKSPSMLGCGRGAALRGAICVVRCSCVKLFESPPLKRKDSDRPPDEQPGKWCGIVRRFFGWGPFLLRGIRRVRRFALRLVIG